jgi:hypothetical protein
MPDPRRRKKRPVTPPFRASEKPIPHSALGKRPVASDLDVDALQALVRISGGDPSEFSDHLAPPDEVREWLKRTDIRHVRGMLLDTVRRWLELRARRVGR